MAKNSITLVLVICILGAVVHAYDEKSELNEQKASKAWCIAKADAPDDKLIDILNYLCVRGDCSAIQPGGSCFEPSTAKAHASYVLNQHYLNKNGCDNLYGKVISVDPSYDNCHYQALG